MPNDEVKSRLSGLYMLQSAMLVLVVGAVILLSGGMVWIAYEQGQNSARLAVIAEQTHDSLCDLKRDLQVRYRAGLDFVKENPNGIPGISNEQIQQSLSSQRATLTALADLDCRSGVS